MSNFEVKTNNLRSCADKEQDIANRIDRISAEIDNIAGRMRVSNQTLISIRKKLRNNSTSIENSAKKLSAMSKALDKIADIYEKSEGRIKNKDIGIGESISDIRTRINTVADDIRKLMGTKGMDNSCAYSPDPVNLSNGNYVYEKNFFSYDTFIPVNLRLFYNVLEKKSGVLGAGWVHNFEKKLVFDNGFASVSDDDGSENRFAVIGDEFLPADGSFGELFKSENGFTYVDISKNKHIFDENGFIKEQSTPDGWKINCQYSENKLISINCSDGIALEFSYDGNKLSCVTDHAGRSVSFRYKNGILSSVTDPEGYTTSYGYDSKNRLCKIISAEGTTALENFFDDNDRTLRQVFPDGGVLAYDYNDPEKLIVMTRQNGSRVSYYHDEYFRNVKTVYTDGEELTEYNRDHQRISFTDKIGNTYRYRYDEHGNISGFVNPLGQKMDLTYNSENQVTSIVLEEKVLFTAEYDEKNHQVSNTDANGGKIFYKYDDGGQVTCITNADGSQTRFAYNKNGNIVSVAEPQSGLTTYEYDECFRVIKSTDALGNPTYYDYDKADRLTKVTNANGDTKTYTYDSRGNIIKVVDFNDGVSTVVYNEINKPVKYTDADGNITAFEYDLSWNIIKKKTADGGEFSYKYDAEGRLVSICDPMGAVEEAVYDPAGNLIQRTAPDGGIFKFEHDALGRVISVTDPCGGKKSAEYDVLGNVTSITHEDGSTELSTYDALGNKLTYTDPTGAKRYFEYDALGNVTLIRDDSGVIAEYEYLPGGLLSKETKTNGSVAFYYYDAAGNVTEVNDTNNGIWKFSYDALGNVISASHGDSFETYTYDAVGNVTSVTDGCGNTSEYRYSPAGALTFVKDANGTETGYEYNPCYRLRRILQPENGILLADEFNKFNREQKNLRITEYTRDLNGNVLSAKGADGTLTSFTYDACGRVTSKTDGDNNSVICEYRLDGTEKEVRFSDGKTIRYEYDALKRLSAIEDWLGITRFHRDAAGRITEVESHDNQVTKYAWGDRGECREIIHPNNKKISYEYNERMLLSACRFEGKEVNYHYYPDGKLGEKTFPDNFSTRYRYDATGRISEIINSNGSQVLDSYSYEYDLCDRKSRRTEKHNDSNIPSGNFRFSYTPSGALASVEKDGVPYQNFEYDIFGNRTSMLENGVKTTYSYDKFGRMTAMNNADGEFSYSYDNRGNLKEAKLNGIRKLSLHFDALNRLSKAESDTVNASYIYNGLDMLIGKNVVENGIESIEKFNYDYSRNIYNLIGVEKNGETENIVWGNDLVAALGDDGNSFYFNDERMSPVGIVKNGLLSGRKSYDPFGAEISGFGSGLFADFTFGGYIKDRTTNMYNGNMRHYDASNGRFISCDPVGGNMARPVTLNPYAYCLSDPYNYYDPTGMILAWLAGGVVGAVVNVGVKFVGDVAKSVAAGEWQGSSWKEYTGAAVGGFVEGSVTMVAGPAAGGAAGAATETLVTNGLKMATKEEGYRKEDGYGFGNLIADTAISGGIGAATGVLGDAIGKGVGKVTKNLKIKIPGINKGKGSYMAVWKQLQTKAQKGLIKNMTGKSMMKGLVSEGFEKGIKSIGKGFLEGLFPKTSAALNSIATIPGLVGGVLISKLMPHKPSAKCPAAE